MVCLPPVDGGRWLVMAFSGCRRLSMAVDGFQWLSKAFNGCRRFSMAVEGFQWLSTAFNGCRWRSMALNGCRRLAMADPCPMSQRNLPASFWNSHYHAGMSGYATAGSSMGLTGHESLYPDYSGLHGLHQSDPWTYNFTTAGQYPHHRSVADFTYMPSSSRYPHNYSSLLMGRPRLPQCVVGKADPWTGAPRLHDEMTFDPTAAYTHHFSSMSGLEGAGASQEGSKDLYWF
nr:protein vestigial-like [Procambarus clarkii]